MFSVIDIFPWQAVAPIVGRADLLCGFFAVIALSLTVGEKSLVTRSNTPGGLGVGVGVGTVDDKARGEEKSGEGSSIQQSKGGQRGKRNKRNKQSGSVGSGRKKTLPKRGVVVHDDSTRQYITASRHQDVTAAPPVKAASAATEGTKTADHDLLTGRRHLPKAAVVASIDAERAAGDGDQSCAKNAEGKGVNVDSGPGALIFLAALGFAFAATLCKEIGVTVFGLIAGADVVRFLGEGSRRQPKMELRAGDDFSGKLASMSYPDPLGHPRTFLYSGGISIGPVE